MFWETVFFGSALLVLYHHFLYPAVLKWLARRPQPPRQSEDMASDVLPSVGILVPAFNEARYIEDKLRQLARIDYPRERFKVILACDGCTDETVKLAHAVSCEAEFAGLDLSIVEFVENRGKVAVLNEVIARLDVEIVLLTDASAELPVDVLRRAVPQFAVVGVGVVCPTYELPEQASAGEKAYWVYQREIKSNEAALGAPIGAHGACYLFRRDLWQPLEPDTINDDVILPMRIVERGWLASYDTGLLVRERETSSSVHDFKRRMRIGAGNMQQVVRLWRLADPMRPGVVFSFISGKTLRALAPFLLVMMLVASLILSVHSLAWGLLTVVSVAAFLLGVLMADAGPNAPKSLVWLSYFVMGHLANGLGGLRYLTRAQRVAWRRVSAVPAEPEYVHPVARIGKRVLDIVCALLASVAFLILVVPLAIAIKLESKGPVFYRQLRVGRRGAQSTELFWLTKFRTMRSDAETKSGAVWASAHDPRVTRLGRFMRNSRLDELPQCFNVLRGEMSIVGPRPERPQFFSKLEGHIPFYIERTYGLKPGITGLAQVSQGYDTSIEDVRSKVLYDHAYALRIARPMDWLKTDLSIILRTFTVMVLGKGQ